MEMEGEDQVTGDSSVRVADFEEACSLEIHRHDALWEEEKHYTWWAYVLIGFIAIIITSKDIDQPLKSSVVFLISLFGVFVSLLGFIVIRKEGSDLNTAKSSRNRAGEAISIPGVKVFEPANHRLVGLRYKIDFGSEDDTLAKDREEKDVSLMVRLLIRELGIRDCFQVLLFVSATGFALVSGYTVWEFLDWASRLLNTGNQERLASVIGALVLVCLVFQYYSLPKRPRL